MLLTEALPELCRLPTRPFCRRRILRENITWDVEDMPSQMPGLLFVRFQTLFATSTGLGRMFECAMVHNISPKRHPANGRSALSREELERCRMRLEDREASKQFFFLGGWVTFFWYNI